MEAGEDPAGSGMLRTAVVDADSIVSADSLCGSVL